MENKKVLMKPTELAIAISASPAKVYRGIADGSIPSVRIAGMIRVPAAFVADLAARAMNPEGEHDER